MFRVQKHMCVTCIYRENSPLDVQKLENDIADPYMPGQFVGHRICHHSDDACCAGFWAKHKDNFPIGQIAQRFNAVQKVEVDTLAKRINL